MEYLELWTVLSNLSLSDIEDRHIWSHNNNGLFSTKSAYRLFFYGAVSFEPWRRLWKSWAPPKCQTLLWLAINDKCWTTDQLIKRGLPHPLQCALCDQEDETVQHILVGCVFAREFWYRILSCFGLNRLTPGINDSNFAQWWRRSSKQVAKAIRKGFNTLIILGA